MRMTEPKDTTIKGELVKKLWVAIKDMRDQCWSMNSLGNELDRVLEEMEEAGMSAWLPSFEDVRGILKNEDQPAAPQGQPKGDQT